MEASLLALAKSIYYCKLSYDAELSCLSESSISLASEKKKSAVFGSQRTATLDWTLVSVKWRHWLTTQLVSVLSFSTCIFFDSNCTILTCVCSHDICICIIFFSFVNIYFANLESYFFTAFDVFYKFQLMYYVFNTFLTWVKFCRQQNTIVTVTV